MGNTVLGSGTLYTKDRNKDIWFYWLIDILLYIKISVHDFKAIEVLLNNGHGTWWQIAV